MIECSSCHTLNPDAERTCLACGAGLTRAAQTGAATMGLTRCPAGHPIDPSWKNCPYCDRLQSPGSDAAQPQRSTRLEPSQPAPPPLPGRTRLEGTPPEAAPPPPFTPKPTRLEEPAPPPKSERRTVLQESSPAVPPPLVSAAATTSPAEAAGYPQPAARGGAAPSRRLLGVLAAPDLGPGGTVFPIRAGRNTIGADRANDIVLDGDAEVSGEHAVILHRNGTFHLADRLSTNGTWLNRAEVPANGTVPLNDRDRIRCGQTDFIFLVIEPGGGESFG